VNPTAVPVENWSARITRMHVCFWRKEEHPCVARLVRSSHAANKGGSSAFTWVKSRICSKTYESYESLLAKYIRPSLGKKSLVAIRPLDIQAAYQHMSDRGLSPRTVQGAHWVLNAAFRQALQWEMILEVPTKGLNLPQIRRHEMRVFSVEEAKTFLKFALPTMYGTLFAVAVTTEMRPSEYIGIKWQDVDWDRGTVSVKRTLRKGPTGQWEYGETKRAGSRRIIRLQNWVLAKLKDLNNARQRTRSLIQKSGPKPWI
jgi:integrase